MPKYLVTSGSHFQPFSYDDLIKPVEHMQQVHDAAQDAYDTLNLETNALAQYITDNPDDAQAKAIYNTYVDKLGSLQDSLFKNGVTGQTRRDLSAARSGYAKDITRIASAVKNRQERSKEYWDARHKDPSLVTGRDPGASGLDNYLNDTLYGQNWYSYSGTDFMNEVGTDAKARADELLRNPEILKNPEIAGYITRISQEGFSSQEVANAGNVVEAVLNGRMSADDLSNLTMPEQLLADVLISHLNSTGAKDQVSPEEFSRLVQYGRAGLSQAIGKTNIDDLNDKVWDAQQDWNLWKRKKDYETALAAPKNGKGKDKGPQMPYTLNDISTYMESNDAKKINKTVGDKFIDPFKNPIVVTAPSGQSGVISSPYDAESILNQLGKDAFKTKYGVDPNKPTGNWKALDENGNLIDYRVTVNAETDFENEEAAAEARRKKPFKVFKKNADGKWEEDEQRTAEFNVDLKGYKDRLSEWEKQNNGIDLQKLAISDRDREKIYKKNNIPEDVPFEDVPAILLTKAKEGRVIPAVIAGSTKDMESTRNNFVSQIATAFSRSANKKGKVEKTSEAAFYPVDGFNISDSGETDIEKVFGKRDSSGRLNDNALTEITVLPEDLEKNRVRITVNGKQYAVNPAMLGDAVDVRMKVLEYGDAQHGIPSVDYMMAPIFDPVSAVMASPQEEANWTYNTSRMLGDYIRLVDRDEDGNITAIGPRDIVHSPELQTQLRTAVRLYMNNILADARDEMMQLNMQVRGNTSANASGYNDYLDVAE